MALIYAYLVSWVGGGVLLAGDLLLARPARAVTAPEASTDEGLAAPKALENPAQALESPAPRRSWHVLLAMAAVGFGGAGLALEALGSLNATQRPAAALAVGALLLLLAAWLSRPRRPELV